MLRSLCCVLLAFSLSACVSEPVDPSFIGARAFDADEASKTRVSLGLTYLQNGNFSQAKFNLDKALEFAPRNGQAHFAMAFYYQQVDEPELAEESYETALSYSRNDPDVVNSYGAFLCQQGKYDKAKEYFLKAVNDRNYASTAETYENLAICSQSQGKNQEAISYFNSALNHQPTRAESLFLLTRLYVEEEQWENAKRTLFKYERNAQVSAETLYLQFQIAQGLNDTKTAVGYGEILKSMFPDHPNTQKYLVQMGKFQPSATVTRKIRAQTKASQSGKVDSDMITKVLEDTSVVVVAEDAGNDEAVAAVAVVEEINEQANEAVDEARAEPLADAKESEFEVAETTSKPAEVKLSAEEIGYSSVSEITIIDTTKPEEDLLVEETETTAAVIEENDEGETALEENLADDTAVQEPDEESTVLAVEESLVSEAASEIEPPATESEALALVNEQVTEPEQDLDPETQSGVINKAEEAERVVTVNDLEDTVQQNNTTIEQEVDEASNEAIEAISTDADDDRAQQESVLALAEEETANTNEIANGQAGNTEYHTVVKGENLYRISLKYNVKMQSLLEWNNMSDASSVQIGSQLRVREPSNND